MRRAQSVVEYALIVATVAILVLLGAAAFGGALTAWLDSLAWRIIGA